MTAATAVLGPPCHVSDLRPQLITWHDIQDHTKKLCCTQGSRLSSHKCQAPLERFKSCPPPARVIYSCLLSGSAWHRHCQTQCLYDAGSSGPASAAACVLHPNAFPTSFQVFYALESCKQRIAAMDMSATVARLVTSPACVMSCRAVASCGAWRLRAVRMQAHLAHACAQPTAIQAM